MWLHLLLEKAVVLHLNNFEFPLPNDAFFQVWFKWAQWFYGRKLKCEDTDRGADNRQQANKKLILSFSSSELKQSKVLIKQKIRGLDMSLHRFNRQPPVTIVLGIVLRPKRVTFYALFISHFFPQWFNFHKSNIYQILKVIYIRIN